MLVIVTVDPREEEGSIHFAGMLFRTKMEHSFGSQADPGENRARSGLETGEKRLIGNWRKEATF